MHHITMINKNVNIDRIMLSVICSIIQKNAQCQVSATEQNTQAQFL